MKYFITKNDDIINGTNDPDKVEWDSTFSATDHDIIRTFGGNDEIVSESGSVDIDAGDGNDSIISFVYSGAGVVDGGSGDDQIEVYTYGKGASFVAKGGTGNDVFTFRDKSNRSGPIAFNGGDGDDTFQVPHHFAEDVNIVLLDNFTLTSVEYLSLSADIAATGTLLNQFQKISGGRDITLRDSSLFLGKSLGAQSASIYASKIMNVDMTGAKGNYEFVCADRPNDDHLTGGSGNDWIFAGGGNDVLNGGSGADVLIGGIGADRLDGNDGIDTADYIGSTSAVRIDLGFPSRTAFGDAQGDSLVLIENIRGSAYGDSLHGNDEANFLEGRDGNDRLDGRAFFDHLKGENGDDVLIGGADADVLDGGQHTDTASYETSAFGVRADLSNYRLNNGDAAGDRFVSIENLLGSTQNDSLRGNVYANVLNGSGGDDNLIGRGGDDLLIGGTGRDYLDGGLGIDTASYETAAAGVRADIANTFQNSRGDATGDGFVSIENLTGSAFADSLRGDAGDNRIAGGAGDDYITGRTGNDILYGGEGADRFQFFVDLDNTAIVMDYQKGLDRFDLVATIATDQTLQIISGVDGDLDGAADDALVDYGSGQFYIANGQATGVLMSDFVFS